MVCVRLGSAYLAVSFLDSADAGAFYSNNVYLRPVYLRPVYSHTIG